MAEKVIVKFKADAQLVRDVQMIYQALGMDLDSAFNMFLRQSNIAGGLPFQATLPKNYLWHLDTAGQDHYAPLADPLTEDQKEEAGWAAASAGTDAADYEVTAAEDAAPADEDEYLAAGK